ncbi:TPA: hypothetical protein N0F65_008661 [Lagenidium giganteum]|uniref:Uncharacterized protein n=1 Tax=Lagenidium giganteum TaxID=4803 RepID=A0AAV2Z9Z1_9STRA|nr:TPA: hypothetical protein N0F65_008661 [Lagenidium giganteum]
MLRAAAETIEYERDLTINELEALKGNYAAGEELYNALGEAYRLLQQESTKASGNYEATIAKLKEENATATARILEQQKQMMKSTVSETASKNIRSNMNTPQALREYMQQMGVEETPAATNFSTVSDKILFVIKNGKLYKRRNGKPDVNLEENTVVSRDALRGVDPIFTMIAIKHSIEPGVRLSNNNLYAQEAKEIRESGKLLTHEEAHDLNARARRDLPAIEDPSSLTTPKQTDKRDRGESFYNNTTPVIEEKKKLKVNEGSLRPYRDRTAADARAISSIFEAED